MERIIQSEYFTALHGKQILITGASGFLGFYLVFLLLYANENYETGISVVLMMRSMNNISPVFQGLLHRKDVKVVLQDVRNEVILPNEIDYIIHAATTSDSRKLREDGTGVIDSAFNGTKNIIEYAKRARAKSIVYVSSITVLGDIIGDTVVDEDYCGAAKWNEPVACYIYGKRVSEYLAFGAYKSQNVPIKIIRPGYVYGASTEKDSRVYSEIIKSAAENKEILLHSAGYIYRPLIYVMDLIDAVFRVLILGKDGEAYNVSGSVTSIREFAETAQILSGVELNVSVDSQDRIIDDCTRFSYLKVSEHVGWRALNKLQDGIKKSIKTYQWRNL